MSEQAGVEATEPEAVELPPSGDAAFGALMDVLAPEEGTPSAGEEGAAAEAAPAGDGQAAPAGEGGDKAGGSEGAAEVRADGKPAASDDGKPAAAADTGKTDGADGGGAGDLPPEWTASATDLAPKFGELSTALEDKVARAHHAEALTAVKTEHAKYFEQLEKHPRSLIGQQVPKIGGADGEMETLRDSADAKEWQDQVKQVLVEEVRDRASRALEDNGDFLSTIHQSIEVFQNNADLVPRTKEFDVELANRVVAMLQPYELRVDEKLQGWSIAPQPIINQIRKDLEASRSAAPAAKGAATNAEQQRGADGKFTKEDQPQAGISSKAGASSDAGEDWQSALFGTLGLPDFRV